MRLWMRNNRLVLTLFLAIWSLGVGAHAALGDTASPWNKGRFAQTRLIAGTIGKGLRKQAVFAGIQIKLDQGWKTYWRNPGDSGLPPNFDWSRSKNLKGARVLWPAPHRFIDSLGTSIGYKGEVVFPVELSAQRPGEAIDLSLALEYAICKDICVPARAKLALRLDPATSGSRFDGTLQRFLAQVPAVAAQQTGPGPSIAKARATLTGPEPKIVVDARFPEGAEGADLFAEGGDEVYLPPPQKIDVAGGGAVRFTIQIAPESNPAALKGKDVKLTLVSDRGLSETVWRVE